MKNLYTIAEVRQVIQASANASNARAVFEYYKNLRAIIEEKNLKEANPQLYGQYYNLSVQLQFLALNFFDDWNEVTHLVQKHLSKALVLDGYDAWGAVKINLLAEPSLEVRSRMKDDLRAALLENVNQIIDNKKYNAIHLPLTIADWLKDYNSKAGIGAVDELAKHEYLASSEYAKKLDAEDKTVLKKVLNFYEHLKFASTTREGFEYDVPMEVNGKRFIFSGGQAVEITQKMQDMIRSIQIEGDKKTGVADWQQLLQKYPVGSLERRAIEEEIKKRR
jgi:hypothetical protein